jgi:tetratricopeptide (TPR) repeat protein
MMRSGTLFGGTWGSRLAAVLIALGSLAVLWPAAVDAQRASPTELRRARELYSEGQRFFDQGRFAEAEQRYRMAYQTVPNPVVLRAIAAAQERQDNIPGAIETLERFVASPNADPRQRSQVETQLAELRTRPAVLRIRTAPSGVTVLVDGEVQGTTAPREALEVEMTNGEHELELRLDGYQTVTQTVNATAGARMNLEMRMVEGAGASEAEVARTAADPATGDASTDTDTDDDSVDTGGGGGGLGAGFWVTGGVAVAALITGTVFSFLALSEQSTWDDATAGDFFVDQAQFDEAVAARDNGQTFALVADISFGVAIAAGAVAVVFAILGAGDDSTDTAQGELGPQLTLTPWVDPRSGGGAAALLRF